ncbi:MAG: amidohydrolase family protein [Planctomycetes bacterium]|nr:amidohydrolase family protein [Planctomycetota bacterium]
MSRQFDVLIKDAKVVDGTGRAAFQGGVAVRGERIAAVGDVEGDAATVIDGAGLVVCPGFVDAHSHADVSILDYPLAENFIMQGITTVVGGNCGCSMAPARSMAGLRAMLSGPFGEGSDTEMDWETFGEWLSKLEDVGCSPNYVPLVGHNTIRRTLLGEDFRRKASADEVDTMKQFVDQAMRSGAFGLSAGLDPMWPGHYAGVEEIVELAKVAQRYGGLFTPHTRHHQNQWPAARPGEYGYGIFHAPKGEIIAGRYHGLLEAVEISRKANGVQLHIAHFTPAYLIPQPHPAYLTEAAARASLEEVVDKAISEGLDVTYNVLGWSQSIGRRAPMVDSFFSARLLLPDWLRALSREDFARKLKDRAFRDKVKVVINSGNFKFGMIHPLTDPYWMDCYTILECKNGEREGKTLGQIARERRPDCIIEAVYEESLEAMFDILAEDPDTTWALIIDKREYRALSILLDHPGAMPCTDTYALPAEPPPGKDAAPSAYGMFPHYIRTMVKGEGALSLERAVKKVTSVPAREVFGLEDRGVIEKGAYADLVVLDMENISEAGDFLNPARPPEGIEHVLVNGALTYENKTHTGARAGKVLRRN